MGSELESGGGMSYVEPHAGVAGEVDGVEGGFVFVEDESDSRVEDVVEGSAGDSARDGLTQSCG